PLHDGSSVWTLLTAALPNEPRWVLELVQKLARCGATGAFERHGVPTGSALCNPLINLYLTDLDATLERQSLAHFRYGDDVCVVLESAESADALLEWTVNALAHKELWLRPEKIERIYWTGS